MLKGVFAAKRRMETRRVPNSATEGPTTVRPSHGRAHERWRVVDGYRQRKAPVTVRTGPMAHQQRPLPDR